MYLILESIQATLRLDGGRGFVSPGPAKPSKVVLCKLFLRLRTLCMYLIKSIQARPEGQGGILTPAPRQAEAVFCKLAKKEWPGQVVARVDDMVTVQLFNKARLVTLCFFK